MFSICSSKFSKKYEISLIERDRKMEIEGDRVNDAGRKRKREKDKGKAREKERIARPRIAWEAGVFIRIHSISARNPSFLGSGEGEGGGGR